MISSLKKNYYKAGVAMTLGMISMASGKAMAQTNVDNVVTNFTDAIANFPKLITGLAYLAGITLGVLGVMKLKDHVENPQNNPLKDGAVRLAAGGSLLALPFLFNVMTGTISGGDTTAAVGSSALAPIDF